MLPSSGLLMLAMTSPSGSTSLSGAALLRHETLRFSASSRASLRRIQLAMQTRLTTTHT